MKLIKGRHPLVNSLKVFYSIKVESERRIKDVLCQGKR